jgi:membrane protein DedA with SNARE-associated domain
MSDFNLTDFFLTWMINYGAPAFGVALFVGAVGVPLPGSLLVLAAGAFARQGVIDWPSASIFGLVGAVLGDTLSYAMGRFAKQWVQRYFGQRTTWQTAQATFAHRGGLAIYLTRFILTQVAIPINLIAGSSGYTFSRFWVFDFVGEVTWLVLYGGLGYIFGNQWELISQFISDFSGLLIGVLVLVVGIYFVWRRQRWYPLLHQQQNEAIE